MTLTALDKVPKTIRLWAGYESDQNDCIDTGDFMGPLYVELDPWIWSSEMDRWFFVPEEHVSSEGGWVFTLM